jgi:EAL domain-containing protein (putative c-di-GMP-specific phosphodiesterase class I)
VIKSIIGLGHELGLKVVAEGVETEREARILRGIGCDELQGFLFARPMEPSLLWTWADEQALV